MKDESAAPNHGTKPQSAVRPVRVLERGVFHPDVLSKITPAVRQEGVGIYFLAASEDAAGVAAPSAAAFSSTGSGKLPPDLPVM